METADKNFEKAVSEALRKGITAEELKKRIDEVNKNDKNLRNLKKA